MKRKKLYALILTIVCLLALCKPTNHVLFHLRIFF